MPIWLSVLLGVFGLLAAGASAVAAWKSWNIAKRAFKLESDRSAPRIQVTTRRNDDAPSLIMLEIRNVGQGIAYEIEFESSRPLPMRAFGFINSENDEELEQLRSKISVMDNGPLITGIPALAPGDSRTLMWGQFGGLYACLKDDFVRITAAYKDEARQAHESLSVVEVLSYRNHDASDNRPISKLTKEIRELKDLLRQCLTREGVVTESREARELRDDIWAERRRQQREGHRQA